MPIQRLCLVLGVGLSAAVGLSLQVTLTRLFSVLIGHHHALMAVSLGLFGAALGGVAVYLVPSIARPPHLLARLAYLAGVGSAAVVGALIFLMAVEHIKPDLGPTITRLGLLYVVTAIPFVAIGAILAATLRHRPADLGRLYAADLIGAAFGAIATVPLIRVGAPRANHDYAVVLAIASVLFAIGSAAPSPAPERERVARPSVVASFLLAAVCLLLGDLGDPWATVPSTSTLNMRRVEYSTWSVLSFVTVDRPVRGMAWIRTDGRGTSAILDEKTQVARHPDEMAYALHGAEGPVLIVGPGGGREVRAALDAGQTEIVGVEIDRGVARDVMLGRYKEFSGGLYDKPEVEVVIADGRTFARTSGRTFKTILLSLVDTAAAGPAGSLPLSENGLYTVEGVADFIEALDDDGTLVINRWDREFERLLGVSAAGLRESGATKPSEHLFACSHARSTSLLIKGSPLTGAEVDKLRRYCATHRYKEVFAPDDPKSARNAALADAVYDHATAADGSDLSPPTDDRPFFFYTVSPDRWPELLGDRDSLAREHPALWTIWALLAASGAVAVLLLVLPLIARPRSLVRSPHRARLASGLAFFGAIGAGFALTEVVLVSRLGIFLGHPAYALSVAAASLLVSGGAGSLWAARVAAPSAEGVGSRLGQALVVVLVGYALGLDWMLDVASDLRFAGRLVTAFVLCGLPGALMGTQLPLGLRAVAIRSDEVVPWCLAASGVTAVVATAGAMLVALHYGFSVLLLFAALSYFLASVFLPPVPPAYRGSLLS